MTTLVVRGDALHLPLRDNTVDLCISSPPYFALRSYATGHEMEVGSEATPHAYLEALWAATREMARVLKPTGSIWINLGDKYAERGGPARDPFADGGVVTYRAARPRRKGERETGVREKSLIGLPWRYAIGCIDQLGLILRAEVIWSKPNGLPESVTDRVRRSHETWFHFVRSPRYYAALDEIRTPHISKPQRRLTPQGRNDRGFPGGERRRQNLRMDYSEEPIIAGAHPLGALPGSVWSIPSEPLRLPPWIDTDHYAAFPSEWPRRLILAFSPPGICVVCGVGRFPVVERERSGGWNVLTTDRRQRGIGQEGSGNEKIGAWRHRDSLATILGYACGCTPHTDHLGTGESSGLQHSQSLAQGDGYANVGAGWGGKSGYSDRPKVGPWREYHLDRFTPPPWRPSVILDPFGGTGTVAHVAHALGRHAISIDLSEPYCRLASDQTLARQRAAKVLGRVHQERQGTLL